MTERVIRVEGAVSHTFKAQMGNIAGSGLATAEMRVVMIRIVDQASKLAPQVVPALFVDDLSVEASGGYNFVQEQLLSFTKAACWAIQADVMEISRTKSVCTASKVS